MMRSRRYLLRMAVFVALVSAAAAALLPALSGAFMSNWVLNGLILVVLAIGIIYIFNQVFSLAPAMRWLEQLKRETQGGIYYPESLAGEEPPRILAPMVRMLSEKRGRLQISALSMRTLLDGIQIRIDESHDISRYLIGLLIFLGLLGTFWGLLQTVASVGTTIGGLGGAGGDPALLFDELKKGLEQPLEGMGTAFSSSLFGLAGSLVLGFLEINAGQAHNRFVNDLEEWLSGVTRLSGGGGVGDGETSVPAYIQALLEQTADSLDNLQRTIAHGEEDRHNLSRSLSALVERMSTLSDQMRSEQHMLRSLSEALVEMRPLFQRLADSERAGGLDENSREHLRNVDLRLAHLMGEMQEGRETVVKTLRDELRLLTRTLAHFGQERRS